MDTYQKNLKESLAFTPKLALDFVALIEKQAKPVYESMGIEFPVITSSTVHMLGHYQQASLSDIAKALDISHQLASQRVKSLLKLAHITPEKDAFDKRRTIYKLTKLGIEQHKLLLKYLAVTDSVFEKLNSELNVKFNMLFNELHASFSGNSLMQRINGIK